MWAKAVERATEAVSLSQSAVRAEDWDGVAIAWSQAITELQAIPPNSPQRIFAQRKVREYIDKLQIAQVKAESLGSPRLFPTFGSDIFDEQLGIYLSYLETVGVPDVLVIGSSRALQGFDPQALQLGLAIDGLPGISAYNFSINGATAQVLSFVLRQLLTPDQLPKMVVWPVGSRALNSGRFDRTFAEILQSPGYAAVKSNRRPSLSANEAGNRSDVPANAVTVPVSPIDANGFWAIDTRFDPNRYYRQFPRVLGRYDDAYRSFNLTGVQTVSFEAIASFLRSRNIPLVVVNLPLSSDYLDATRLQYERQFQQFLQRQARTQGFTLVDMLEQWRGQNAFFADPSHLNRYGAAAVAHQLAVNPQVPWERLRPIPAEAEPTSPENNPETEPVLPETAPVLPEQEPVLPETSVEES